jgi:Na+/melibiose symporter-like transporter
LIFTSLIILCIASAIATLITFFLYIRARMADRTETQDSDPDVHAQRLAVLDRQERRWLSLHFITLFLFVLFGVLILIHLSDSIRSGTSYTLLADKLPNLFV